MGRKQTQNFNIRFPTANRETGVNVEIVVPFLVKKVRLNSVIIKSATGVQELLFSLMRATFLPPTAGNCNQILFGFCRQFYASATPTIVDDFSFAPDVNFYYPQPTEIRGTYNFLILSRLLQYPTLNYNFQIFFQLDFFEDDDDEVDENENYND